MDDVDSTSSPAIRSLVSRVIDELGPLASPREVQETAAAILRTLHSVRSPIVTGSMHLIDLPDFRPPTMEILRPMVTALSTRPVALRTRLDLETAEDATALRGRIAALDELLRSESPSGSRLHLAIAPVARAIPLDFLAELIDRCPTLRATVVCARPGLGVDPVRVESVGRLLVSGPAGLSDRLTFACMRTPVARSGSVRLEVTATGVSEPPDGLPEAFASPPAPPSPAARIVATLDVPACTPSDRWGALKAWRPPSGPGHPPYDGLRSGGWPARGVRSFRSAPLCADDDPTPHLLSLAAAGSVASVSTADRPSTADVA